MERVTGFGGLFFKAEDPKRLQGWYQEHLGITPDGDGTVCFRWREEKDPQKKGYTVWAPFPKDTRYFEPSKAPFMMNFRVADLDGLLEQLRKEGVDVEDKVEEMEYGRFGWILDPEGNRIELWQPAEES